MVFIIKGKNNRRRLNEECKEGWVRLKYFLYMHRYGRLKPVEVIFRRRVREEGEKLRGWSKEGTIYVYMEMSQKNPMNNYHILIFLKKNQNPPIIQKTAHCFFSPGVWTQVFMSAKQAFCHITQTSSLKPCIFNQ
jgi:hypothetical protein